MIAYKFLCPLWGQEAVARVPKDKKASRGRSAAGSRCSN